MNYFQECTTTEVPDYIDNEVDCNNANGEWDNTGCYCGGSSTKLEIGEECEITETIEEEPSTASSTPTSTVTSSTGSTETSSSRFADMSSTQKWAIAGIAVLVIFLIYWQFEKGPQKGLIKKRKGRRK